ncbi:hypothetical protein Ccrd_001900, partial [Cynara cardunculus var. scolymus]
TKSPLTTNHQPSSGWVLSGRSEQHVTPTRHFFSWAAVSRLRDRFAPCPRIWLASDPSSQTRQQASVPLFASSSPST